MSRYHDLLHAMQTGVAMWMHHDPQETQPKHLRVGVNAAACDTAALAKLLIAKGVITFDEYSLALETEMENEVGRYAKRLNDQHPATKVTLV